MGVDDWSTDEAQNASLGNYDVSRGECPDASTSEHARELMANIKALSDSVDERFENFVGENIEVDGITIENNDGVLTVKDVAIDGDTEDLLTEKIAEIEAAAETASGKASDAATAAEQAAASASAAVGSVSSAVDAANAAAAQASLAAQAAARAQSGAAMAESAVQAVIAGTNLNWQRSEKAGAVAVYPVPETTLHPVVEFAFTETDPAEGDKSPDNPSTITGVSSAKVTMCGKNLVPYIPAQASTFNGVSFSVAADGRITVNGTAGTGNANFDLSASNVSADFASAIPVLAGHTYTVSGCPSGGSSSTYCMFGAQYDKGGHAVAYNVLNDTGSGKSYTPSVDGYIFLRITITAGYTASSLVFSPQIEEASTATSYESPERSVYAIDLGGTFYGGSVDLSAGVMTVTHVMVEPDSLSFDISAHPADTASFQYADTFGRTVTTNGNTLTITGETGGKIVYNLATPETVSLSPLQIYSLSQPDPYAPRINTVYSDQTSVQVGHAKSPIRSEYELTQAIIATEGGE